MKYFRRILSRGRVKSARLRLAQDPSPKTYAALAQEYIRDLRLDEALSVCEEGLQAFTGNTLLSRLAERTRRAEREERITKLRSVLSEAPRPALWEEMCEILLELGRVGKAEETALTWVAKQDSLDARLMLARVRTERFFADRGRDLGLAAISALSEAEHRDASDSRAIELKLTLFTRIGAWRDARETVRQLLQFQPGSPELEARFRAFDDQSETAPTVDQALLVVERTGRFADDDKPTTSATRTVGSVRPILRELESDADVHAALYLRGSTVLIQGPKGATAERMARSVRSILTSGRSTTRRLGMGQIFQVQVEGDFGKLSIAPGEMDAGAIWSRGGLGRTREETLLGLAGLNADLGADAVEVLE